MQIKLKQQQSFLGGDYSKILTNKVLVLVFSFLNIHDENIKFKTKVDIGIQYLFYLVSLVLPLRRRTT